MFGPNVERLRAEFSDVIEGGGTVLVRIHFIIVMIRWTGLAPWEFEFPFPGSLAPTFLEFQDVIEGGGHGTLSLLQGYLAHKKPPPPRTLQ